RSRAPRRPPSFPTRRSSDLSATLENLEAVSGALALQRRDLSELVVAARASAQELEATLRATRGAVEGLDRELVSELPALVEKLRSEEHTSELQSRENLVCRL